MVLTDGEDDTASDDYEEDDAAVDTDIEDEYEAETQAQTKSDQSGMVLGGHEEVRRFGLEIHQRFGYQGDEGSRCT